MSKLISFHNFNLCFQHVENQKEFDFYLVHDTHVDRGNLMIHPYDVYPLGVACFPKQRTCQSFIIPEDAPHDSSLYRLQEQKLGILKQECSVKYCMPYEQVGLLWLNNFFAVVHDWYESKDFEHKFCDLFLSEIVTCVGKLERFCHLAMDAGDFGFPKSILFQPSQ